jgi:hypothetical protein
VRSLLETYDLADHYDEVAYWYNGYLFGGTVIYNPWSVLNYVASRDHQPRSYWVNTASADIIERLITREGQELRQEIGQLLEGRTLCRPISENIVMRDLETQDNLLWSFLLFSGYLKVTEQCGDEDFTLKVPNNEVLLIYRKLIKNWFEKTLDLTSLQELLNALQQGNVQVFEQKLTQIVLEVMSYHDMSGSPEKVYQALVLGMLVWLSGPYNIRTNRESGYGRYDMMFTPKKAGARGIIIEFKRVADDEKPETVLNNALEQITDRQYATELRAAGVHDVLQLAVAFRGKELWVKDSRQAATPGG